MEREQQTLHDEDALAAIRHDIEHALIKLNNLEVESGKTEWTRDLFEKLYFSLACFYKNRKN